MIRERNRFRTHWSAGERRGPLGKMGSAVDAKGVTSTDEMDGGTNDFVDAIDNPREDTLMASSNSSQQKNDRRLVLLEDCPRLEISHIKVTKSEGRQGVGQLLLQVGERSATSKSRQAARGAAVVAGRREQYMKVNKQRVGQLLLQVGHKDSRVPAGCGAAVVAGRPVSARAGCGEGKGWGSLLLLLLQAGRSVMGRIRGTHTAYAFFGFFVGGRSVVGRIRGTHAALRFYTVRETLLCCPGTQKKPLEGDDNEGRQDAPVGLRAHIRCSMHSNVWNTHHFSSLVLDVCV